MGGAPLPPLGVAPQGAREGRFWQGRHDPQNQAWRVTEDLRPEGGVGGHRPLTEIVVAMTYVG